MEIVPCMEKKQRNRMPLGILVSGTGTHTGTNSRKPLLAAILIPPALRAVS
jgi:hypothetical protein